MFPRTEMLDLIVIDGRARGIVVRDMVTGADRRPTSATRWCWAPAATATSSISPPTPRARNATAIWRAYKRGAAFANPCFTQIHPTCIPVSGDYQSKLTLMSESLRNDGRVWVPKRQGDNRPPAPDSRGRARLLPGAHDIPASATWRPRDIASPRRQGGVRRRPRRRARAGWASTSISPTRSSALGAQTIRERYGNLFEMYQRITDENPYRVPMRIYPAVHYTMGGLWVDYNLMSTIPGLHVIGEANFSDHGANRLGASALMQGLADGYFILPTPSATISAARQAARRWMPRHPECPRGRGARSPSRPGSFLGDQGQADGGLASTASWAS